MNLKAMRMWTVLALLMVCAASAKAVEGLQLSLQCSNVVLTWPSIDGDTYLIQRRSDLTTNSSWVCLTNSYPAASGTNITVFIDSGIVSNANCSGSGGMEMMRSASLPGSLGPISAPSGTQSYPPLPPCPPGAQYTQTSNGWTITHIAASSYSLAGENSFTPDDGSGSPFPPGPTPPPGSGSTNTVPPDAEFYEVVKVGVHLYGITNGQVLSGVVPLNVEFGDSDTNSRLISLYFDDLADGTPSPVGVSFPTYIDSPPTNWLQGTWDTTQLTNGTYTIQLGAELSDYSTCDDHPVTVVVSNAVCWPDDTYWGGLGVYVGAQTIYTNGGTWTLYIYDDEGNQYGPLTGNIDSDGWCNYPGIPGPGFTIDNTDGNGNQNPSSYYDLVLSVNTNGETNIVISSTNTQLIEPAWNNISSDAVLAYQGLFDAQPDGLPFAELLSMIQAVWSVENAFHYEVLGTYETPFELVNTSDWTTLLNTLGGPGTFYNRDFFYFGHGNVDRIGSNASAGYGLTSALVQTRLGTLKGTGIKGQLGNRHPYRFVFLDGCLTSKLDNWCIAFGIPPKLTSNQVLLNHGARPRSFMGWKTTKAIAVGNVGGDAFFSTDHANYVGGFFAGWAQRNPSTGLGLLGVQDAITYAKTYPNGYFNITAPGMRLLGSADMIIDY